MFKCTYPKRQCSRRALYCAGLNSEVVPLAHISWSRFENLPFRALKGLSYSPPFPPQCLTIYFSFRVLLFKLSLRLTEELMYSSPAGLRNDILCLLRLLAQLLLRTQCSHNLNCPVIYGAGEHQQEAKVRSTGPVQILVQLLISFALNRFFGVLTMHSKSGFLWSLSR